MDEDQTPTAWEEINPSRAVSASPPAPRLPSGPWNDPRLALKPATEADFRRELTACLALVGAVGMSEETRREWLIAAWGTLRDIPADLLERGCRAARLKADHPAKIIPAIMSEIEQAWKWRWENRASREAETAPIPRERRIETPPTSAEIEETNRNLERIGAATRYRSDGTRYEVDTPEQKREVRGPLRRPTRQDYLDMGVDPAALDRLDSENANNVNA